jgi:hypothetical protein
MRRETEVAVWSGLPVPERKLRHDGTLHQVPLGCAGCRERPLCGGLAVEANLWSCLSLCCGTPDNCDRVCRNNPGFVARVHEVFGFDLSLPPAPVLPRRMLPHAVPEIYHSSARVRPFAPGAASVSLYRMFDRRTGDPRHGSHADLCRHFQIAQGTPFILTGIQRDRPLERWWELGRLKRREVIRAARDCGAVLATSPNYSLFLDRPRWDDLHAIKRIAWTHHEFLEAGMPAALHINGRTETDFWRWAEYVVAHPEVHYVSYEFTTGTGRPARRHQHAAWLAGLANDVGRPLHLLVRGGTEVLPQLWSSFSRVTFLDTSAFLKTMMRFRAIKGQTIGWWLSPTAVGQPLDDLLETNWDVTRDWFANIAQQHSRVPFAGASIA